MADAAIIDTPTNSPTRARAHPLAAWRLTQRRWSHARRGFEPLSLADAARAFGVPYQTWRAWERFGDDPIARIPVRANMRKLVLFTRGHVRPDHFYETDELRAMIGAASDAGLLHSHQSTTLMGALEEEGTAE